MMPASKRDAGVVTLETHTVSGALEPESESVAFTIRDDASRPDHLRDPLGGDEAAAEERPPQRRDIGGGRIDAAVAVAANRQMQDVAAHGPGHGQVAERRPSRKFVGS